MGRQAAAQPAEGTGVTNEQRATEARRTPGLHGNATVLIHDTRPSTLAHQRLQQLADQSPKAMQLRRYADLMAARPVSLAQPPLILPDVVQRAGEDGAVEEEKKDQDNEPMDEVAPEATSARPGRTAQWEIHAAALRDDLLQIIEQIRSGELTDEVLRSQRGLLNQAATAVLIYQAHIASFVDLNPLATSGGSTRQENPYEREHPGFYYRSQLKEHPQFVMLKDLVEATTDYTRRETLPPYNTKAQNFIYDNTSPDTKAKTGIKVDHPEPNITIRKGSHSELPAAHIGLRQTNAAALASAVDRFLGGEETLTLLVKQLDKRIEAKDSTVPDATSIERSPVTADDLYGVLDGIGQVMGKLGCLDGTGSNADSESEAESETPDASDMRAEIEAAIDSDGAWSQPTAQGILVITRNGNGDEPAPFSWAITPSRGDAFGSESYVTRKIAQQNLRADAVLAHVGTLTYLKVGRLEDNAQITLDIPHKEKLTETQSEAFTSMMRVYLAALLARHAAARDLPLAGQQRQSFGSLETTLADTGSSIRISVGSEPVAFQAALADAIRALDTELAAQVKAKKAGSSRKAFYGIQPGKSTYQKIDSPDLQRFLYLKVLSKSLDLRGMIAYVKDPNATGFSKESGSWRNTGKGTGTWDQLLADARATLADNRAKKTIDAGDPFADPMPIAEPLQNALVMVASVVRHFLDGESPPPTPTPAVRRSAFAELARKLVWLDALLDELIDMQANHDSTRSPSTGDGPLQPPDASMNIADATSSGSAARESAYAAVGRLHLDLRNVTEDLIQAVLILLSTSNEYLDARPEDAVAAEIQHRTGSDSTTVRADSGEQAGTLALAALQGEAWAAEQVFDVGVDHEATYFEFKTFFEENNMTAGRLEKEVLPSAVLIDPRPYRGRIPDDAEPPQPEGFATKIAALVKRAAARKSAAKGKDILPLSIVIDTTGTDYAHPDITGAIAAAQSAVANGAVRFVLFNSGVKHEQQGVDRYQIGRITTVGHPIQDLDDFSSSTLVTQLLGLLNELREADGDDFEDIEAPAAEIDLRQYTRFMDLQKQDAWARLTKQYEDAARRKDRNAAADEATAVLALYKQQAESLIEAFATGSATDITYSAFSALPSSEQRVIQETVVKRTGQGLKPNPEHAGTSAAPVVHTGSEHRTDLPGVPNLGTTCYITAALSMIAFVEPYRAKFAPRTVEADGERDLLADERAEIWALLEKIYMGKPIARDEIRHVRTTLNTLGLLLPPSLLEQQPSITVQQDPDEVFLRRVLPRFAEGSADNLSLNQTTVTDFTHVPLKPVGPIDPSHNRTALDGNMTWRQRVPENIVLALSVSEAGNLEQALGNHVQTDTIDAHATHNGQTVVARPRRWIELGPETPDAITIALKRTVGTYDDDHAVAMPPTFDLNGMAYRLQAVVHHLGTSTYAGHYTASTTSGPDGAWHYRNDEVVTAMDEQRAASRRNHGYLYTYVKSGPAQQSGPGRGHEGPSPMQDEKEEKTSVPVRDPHIQIARKRTFDGSKKTEALVRPLPSNQEVGLDDTGVAESPRDVMRPSKRQHRDDNADRATMDARTQDLADDDAEPLRWDDDEKKESETQ
jgi:hypothetical protein